MVSIQSIILQYIISQHGVVHDPLLLNTYNRIKYESNTIDEENLPRLRNELDEIITALNIELDPIQYQIVKHRQYTPFSSKDINITKPPVEWSNIYYCYINTNNSESIKLSTNFKPNELIFVKYLIKELSQPNISKRENIKKFIIKIEKNDILVRYKYMIDKRLQFDNDADADADGHYTDSFSKYLNHLNRDSDSQVITFKQPSSKLISGFRNSINDATQVSTSSNTPTTTTTSSSGEETMGSSLRIVDQQNVINRLLEDKWIYQDTQNRLGLNMKSLIELREMLFTPSDSTTIDDPFQCGICKKIVTLAGIMCTHCEDCVIDVDCLKHTMKKNNNVLKCPKCQNILSKNSDIVYIL